MYQIKSNRLILIEYFPTLLIIIYHEDHYEYTWTEMNTVNENVRDHNNFDGCCEAYILRMKHYLLVQITPPTRITELRVEFRCIRFTGISRRSVCSGSGQSDSVACVGRPASSSSRPDAHESGTQTDTEAEQDENGNDRVEHLNEHPPEILLLLRHVRWDQSAA